MCRGIASDIVSSTCNIGRYPWAPIFLQHSGDEERPRARPKAVLGWVREGVAPGNFLKSYMPNLAFWVYYVYNLSINRFL